MKIGYARVSTSDQNMSLQIDALQKAGCAKIYQEKISGTTKERPELTKLFDQLREGDTIVVWKLDRLGRSIKNIVEIVLQLNQQGVVIKGLTDGVDTSTANGRLFLNIMASLAEYERELIQERTHAGLGAARARGRLGGRPKGLKPEIISKIKMIRILAKDYSKTPKEIYQSLGLTHASYYRYLKFTEKYTDKELDEMAIKK